MYWEVDFEKIPLAVESGRPGEGIHPPRPGRGPLGPAPRGSGRGEKQVDP